jgi:5-methylcytosine-specific restriction endonuclease McrA
MEDSEDLWVPCYATDPHHVFMANDYTDYLMASLSSSAWTCITYLLRHVAHNPRFELHARVDEIAGRTTQTGLSSRTIKRAMSELAMLGVIDIIPDTAGSAATYRVRHRDEWDVQEIDAILVKRRDASDHERRMRTDCHYGRLRLIVVERDQSTCVYCGQVLDEPQIDHVVPICRGGSNDLANLVTSCSACNLSKGRKTLEEWLS